ncbi:hypothetical protein [Methylocystis parvus]|uniref:hypothetical protein n=1 Tax=Methylocystis parvus TaxID=134 RepID=UPI003C766082
MKKYFRMVLMTGAAFGAPAALAMPQPSLPETGTGVIQARGGHGGFHAGGGWHGGSAGVRPGWGGGHYRPPTGGWHGGYYHGRPVARPPVYGGWRRPYYGWRPGGAIAAGAAIGFLSAAAAAAYATSAAPAAGLCWYYTDYTYQTGFWDNCP